jgi:hypothetical protein
MPASINQAGESAATPQALSTFIMGAAMTDEVADDDIGVSQLITLLREMRELLQRFSAADDLMATDKRLAVQAAAGFALTMQCRIGAQLRNLLDLPPREEGAALRYLVEALIDRDKGKPDEVLIPERKGRGAPQLATHTQIDRLDELLAMDLLMAKDALSPERAAHEVIKRQHDRNADALVRQWRDLDAGEKYPMTTELFQRSRLEVKREVEARGLTADAYEAVIRTRLARKKL